MNIELTSIRDNQINLDLNDLEKLLSVVIYPGYLEEFETLYVMIVCVKDEEHSNDAYLYNGEPYFSLALNYYSVAGVSFDEITVICKNRLISFLYSLHSLPVKELV